MFPATRGVNDDPEQSYLDGSAPASPSGDILMTTTFLMINTMRGDRINGIIAALNRRLDAAHAAC